VAGNTNWVQDRGKKMCDQTVHRQFEEMLRGHCAEYHNHKETMAHAALVIQIGLFAWIMTKGTPDWVEDISIPKEWVFFLGYFIMWLLIFLYTVWQLNNRKRAAKLVATLITCIKERIGYVQPQDKIITKYFSKLSEETKGKGFFKGELPIYFGHIIILIFVFLKTVSNTS